MRDTERSLRPTKSGYAVPGTSRQQRKAILERDSYTCVYCGKSATQVDHVIPIWERGPSKSHNLVAACKDCNQGKWAHLDTWHIHQFAQSDHPAASSARRVLKVLAFKERLIHQ